MNESIKAWERPFCVNSTVGEMMHIELVAVIDIRPRLTIAVDIHTRAIVDFSLKYNCSDSDQL